MARAGRLTDHVCSWYGLTSNFASTFLGPCGEGLSLSHTCSTSPVAEENPYNSVMYVHVFAILCQYPGPRKKRDLGGRNKALVVCLYFMSQQKFVRCVAGLAEEFRPLTSSKILHHLINHNFPLQVSHWVLISEPRDSPSRTRTVCSLRARGIQNLASRLERGSGTTTLTNFSPSGSTLPTEVLCVTFW